MKRKPDGITPMTSTAVSFRRMLRPMMCGSPPKRCCHKWWLRTTTRGALGRSSSSDSVRPSSGCTPSSGKNSHETTWTLSRTGSPASVSVKVVVSQAATLRSVRLCALPVEPVRGRDHIAVQVRARPPYDRRRPERLVNREQLVAVGIRQRPQQQLVDD